MSPLKKNCNVIAVSDEALDCWLAISTQLLFELSTDFTEHFVCSPLSDSYPPASLVSCCTDSVEIKIRVLFSKVLVYFYQLIY